MTKARTNPAMLAALLAAAGGWSTGSLAQDRGSDEGTLEEVVVTGSRIKRQDFSSISPIVTLDAEALTLSGITAVEDFLNDTPQLVPLFDRTGNNPGTGAAVLSLRGLGGNRTLVTMNGRRLAPFGASGFVDVNTIPAQLIERVEVVTGGASTVYGSDAIAGVVNFIMDDDFRGLEATAQYDVFEAGDGEILDVSLAFGAGDERGHFTGFLNYQDREPVFAGDRAFTALRLQESFDPATAGQILPAGSPISPAGYVFFPTVPLPGTGGQPVNVTFDPDGTPRPYVPIQDDYNFQPDNYLQIPLERQSLGAFGRYRFAPAVEGFVEVLYSVTDSTSQLAPAPAALPLAVNVDNPLLTPAQRDLFASAFDPDFTGATDGIAQLFFGRRLLEAGPRRLTRDADSLRAVLGLEGTLAARWDWQASYSYSETDTGNVTENGAFASRFQQALLVDPATGACFDPANGCVPFNPFGSDGITEEAIAFLATGPIVDAETVEERILNLSLTGDLLALPAGALGVAAGFEWREIESRFTPDPAFTGGGVLGYNALAPVGGGYDVRELFVEALVPLLADVAGARYLGLEAGYRYSDYELSGGADNWKLGLDWSPIESLRFRVMAQRAIRAPNISELFQQPIESLSEIFAPDPCSASADPVARGVADLCVAQGLPADQVGVFEAQPGFPAEVVTGGNPNLAPEEGDTLTAGVVFQPGGLPNLSVSLDYYEIELDEAIGSVPPAGLLALCFASGDADGAFCRGISRGPTGDIARLVNPNLNLAQRRVEGVDLAVNYRWALGEAAALAGGGASLGLRVLATHTMENSTQSSPLVPGVDCAGFFGGSCAIFGVGSSFLLVPEDRATTRLTYDSGPLSLALNWQWIGALRNRAALTCAEQADLCYPSELGDVDARNYFELSGRWVFDNGLEVYGGVSNLFEEDPPLLGFGATQSNTAPQLYDVFGRRYFLGLRYRL